MQPDSLKSKLSRFDGTDTQTLRDLQAEYENHPGFPSELVSLLTSPEALVSVAATWILKAELEGGTALSKQGLIRLMQQLEALPHWQAELHVLQSVEFLELDRAQALKFSAWARESAGHERPFMRAWSLNARIVLGLSFRELQEDALAAFETGQNDKAASVRARMRNLSGKIASIKK